MKYLIELLGCDLGGDVVDVFERDDLPQQIIVPNSAISTDRYGRNCVTEYGTVLFMLSEIDDRMKVARYTRET